ncbi:solute carrier family 25 member 44-like isoform X2 [Nilaparvata lugens]|uniref:solute carrier family 25 member 44-like isoform X1 n=1 Tax=Nilaparvata lugens TaxID=108931 RepID=UPI00193DD260|nr:solute carrier family 25 member 44-like isoform X1 [Nilaparvata lugens]XP_039281790.1 solute carrier family 25 member 44-like isoform X2 [Nilaparvata lugens]
MSGDEPSTHYVKTIEWDMMDKRKFFPLSMLSSFCVRCSLYPLTLIKTRLQIQKHGQMYNGLWDAGNKIYRTEGVSGLYRGFWVSSVQIVSGVMYIGTYEGVRHVLSQYRSPPSVKAMLGGGAASLVGQTVIVPFDVISQHLMVIGLSSQSQAKIANPLGISLDPSRSKFRTTLDIAHIIYKTDGFRGFYRGYFASLCTYVPNSALWWSFYHFYQDQLVLMLPEDVSHLLVQCIAGTLGGFTTTLLTNPMDTIRARLQVQRTNSILKTSKALWMEEGMWMFSKGLSARLVQSVCFSASIILGYETIKRISVRQEYKDMVRW